MSDKKKVLILGAGFGGLSVAHELESISSQVEVTILEKKDYLVVGATHQYLATKRMTADQLKFPLTDSKLKHGKIHTNCAISKIDRDNKTVHTSKGEFTYDYLVVSLGIEGNAEKLPPGMKGWAYDIANIDHCADMCSKIQDLKAGSSVAIVVCDIPYKCPPAPYEFTMLINESLTKRGIRDQVKMDFFTPEPQPMPAAGAIAKGKLQGTLESNNVTFHGGVKVTEVVGGELKFDNGSPYKADLCVAIYPQLPPTVLKDSGFKVNPKGMAVADVFSCETDVPDVFVIGDCAWLMIPAEPQPKPHPKAGQFAYEQAKAVAQTLRHRITGAEEPGKNSGVGTCYLEVTERTGMLIRNDVGLYAPGSVSISDPNEEDSIKKKLWMNSYIEKWFGTKHTLPVPKQ